MMSKVPHSLNSRCHGTNRGLAPARRFRPTREIPMARNALSGSRACTACAGVSLHISAIAALLLAGYAFAQPSAINSPVAAPIFASPSLDRAHTVGDIGTVDPRPQSG